MRDRRHDTVLCMGNNLGLLGTPSRARQFFTAVSELGTPDCRVVGTMLNPHETTSPEHLAYHERNRSRGDHAGQVRLRVRYRRMATEWFVLLWLSPEELADVSADSGWEVCDATEGMIYAAELRPRRAG